MINQNETREQRILHISDRLLTKIEKSIDEIDRCIVKTKERTKNVEYDSDLKKPINETLLEKENVEIVEGMIDKMGLKQLVSTLKDIKDIHLSFEEGNIADDDEDRGIIVLGEIDEDTLEKTYEIEDDEEE